MSIQEHLNKIRNAIKGSEVRESIAKGIETAYNDASEKDNANMEVKIARGTHPTLRDRLNEVDDTDRRTTEKIDSNYNEVTAQLAQNSYEVIRLENVKADKTDLGAPTQSQVDTWLNNNPDATTTVADNSLTTTKYKEGSVTADKTNFMEPSTNLFNGEYLSGSLNIGTSDMRYTIGLVNDYNLGVVPIDPNTTYTLTVFDEELMDRFYLATLNGDPLINASFTNVDDIIYKDQPNNKITFTTSSNAKTLIFSVSKVYIEPRVMLEEGFGSDSFTKYHILPKESVDGHLFDNDWKEEIIKALPTPVKNKSDSKIVRIANTDDKFTISSGSNAEASLTKNSTITKIGSTSTSLNNVTNMTISRVIPYRKDFEEFHTIGIWLYIPTDAVNKITQITVRIFDGAESATFGKGALDTDGQALKAGWNLLRWSTTHSSAFLNLNTAIKQLTFHFTATEPINLIIGGVWVEKFEKAKLLFIHDGGYEDFFNEDNRGYRDLKERGIPVTIATIPNKTFSGVDRQITPERLYELSLENNNDISIHSFDGEDALATMSPEEVYQESWNAISLLRQHGYNPIWRAAWFRNNVPNAYGARPLFEAFGFHSRSGGTMLERIESFPFTGKYDVSRVQLHGRTNNQIDHIFNLLKKSRGVLVGYTHNVSETSSGDITEELWDYFLAKVDTAINEGWLEGTTYPILKESINIE